VIVMVEIAETVAVVERVAMVAMVETAAMVEIVVAKLMKTRLVEFFCFHE
jgi:hypothetical protein